MTSSLDLSAPAPSQSPAPLFFLVLCSSLLFFLLLPALLLLLFRRLRVRDTNGRHSDIVDAAAPDAPLPPPGDEGLPILGETLRLISAYKSEDPETFMDKRVARYGRVFTSHVFGERTVFSSDPEFNRLVVVHSDGKLFEWSFPRGITALLGRHSLVLSKGPYHKRMHSLTLSTFSSHSALRDHLLPDIDRLVRLNLHSWPWVDGQVLHLLDQAKKITFDMAVKQLLSFEPGEWTERLRKEYQHLIDGFFSLPIPFFSFTTYGRAVQARRRVAEALRLVVRQRMSVFQQKQQEQQEQQKQQQEQKHEKKQQQRSCREVDMLETLLAEGVTEEEQVVDFLLALLVAGYDTTSTTMTLAVKFLTESPAALAALTEEHEAIIRSRKREEEEESGGGAGGGGDPSELPLQWIEYKNSMPFTHCVINETLRMGNIVSGVFRRATADIPVKGYTIPKGCKVFASFRAVHMDPNYHDDARTFNPWRWQQPKKKEEDHHQQQQQQSSLPLQQQQQKNKQQQPQQQTSGNAGLNVFTPFGGGARLCPGYELARVELAVFLHHLVTTFSWEAADEDRLVFFPTTRTLKGYPIRVHHRRRQNPYVAGSPSYLPIA